MLVSFQIKRKGTVALNVCPMKSSISSEIAKDVKIIQSVLRTVGDVYKLNAMIVK